MALKEYRAACLGFERNLDCVVVLQGVSLDLKNKSTISFEERLSRDNHRDAYVVQLDRGSDYTFSAANLEAGGNLRLVLVDDSGNELARAYGSNGSDDPIIRYRADRDRTVRLIVKEQGDSDHRGDLPYTLAVSNDSAVYEADGGQLENPFFVDRLFGFDANLDDLFARLGRDGIELADLDRLLASVTADDGRVSRGEFHTLSRISRNLDQYVDDPVLADYYSYVFSAAVGSNPANRFWTGGVQDRDERLALGDLEVGSTADQVDLLRRKWFLGEDLPLARIDGDTANDEPAFEFNYLPASGPLFEGDINFDEVVQGRAGTCYFLASLMSVATSDSGIIEGMFVDNGNGTYGVRFYGIDGGEAWVTVNRDLPIEDNSLELAGSYRTLDGIKSPETNELWAALAEKALAQVNETGLLRRASTENSYQAIEGGDGEALDYITGQRSLTAYPEMMVEEISFDDVRASAIAGRAVYLGSDVVWSSSDVTQLVEGHAYSVVGFDVAQDAFIVANPWGIEVSRFGNPFDPVFSVPSAQMRAFYNNELVDFAVI